MILYLCVDCGGTKTAAVISDESGQVVGRGLGGPSNFNYQTVEQFVAAVKDSVEAALQQAIPSSVISLPPTEYKPFVAAWFGISGADFPVMIKKAERALGELLGVLAGGPDLIVAHDTHLLAAPLRLYQDVSHAVVVIAGTGSVVVSFKEEGKRIVELARVGGWGWLLGDEGGGYDVGRETLRQILLAHDKTSLTGLPLPKSEFIENVLQTFGADNFMEIFASVYHPDPSPSATIKPGEEKISHNLAREKRISSLPPLVFEAAFEHDDPLALNILKTAVDHLASQIAILLDEGTSSLAKIVKAEESVVSFGGSLVRVEEYRNLLLSNLAARGHVFKHVVFIDDAAATGAVGLAKAYNSKRSSS